MFEISKTEVSSTFNLSTINGSPDRPYGDQNIPSGHPVSAVTIYPPARFRERVNEEPKHSSFTSRHARSARGDDYRMGFRRESRLLYQLISPRTDMARERGSTAS